VAKNALLGSEKHHRGNLLRTENLRMIEDRQHLRRRILAARDGLPVAARREKSRAVLDNFLRLPGMQEWSTLFIYVHFRSEVETVELIKECLGCGMRVAVPLVDASARRMLPLLIRDPAKDLAPGYYDIPEPDPARALPVEPKEIDAAVIPGSVFDIHGGRLGYGGGYYDRFLANDAPQAKRIGFAFEMQVVDKVPLESHDQLLDILITEKRIVNITP
jgi:5-formyltetrahydrofolate cyclo-ligase